MIRRISGSVIQFDEKSALIDVNGVGYSVFMDGSDIASLSIGAPVVIHTHLAIKENAHELYGFLDVADLQFFEQLITVSGIGPKTGLGILNAAPREVIANAIADKDIAPLTRVSGIGKKIAERVVMELHDKVDRISERSSKGDIDVLEGLKALGFRDRDARDALKKTKSTGTSDRIKEALNILQNHE